MQGLILLDFQIFKKLGWIAANYEENVTAIKNSYCYSLIIIFTLKV